MDVCWGCGEEGGGACGVEVSGEGDGEVHLGGEDIEEVAI